MIDASYPNENHKEHRHQQEGWTVFSPPPQLVSEVFI